MSHTTVSQSLRETAAAALEGNVSLKDVHEELTNLATEIDLSARHHLYSAGQAGGLLEARAEFKSQFLNPKGQEAVGDIRLLFSDLLTKLDTRVMQSRERSLMVTALQEASMWAVRGVCADASNLAEKP